MAAPPDGAWIARAKKEGAVTLYTSMQLVDSRPLTEAFEKKYGIKVGLWRASGEKIAEREKLLAPLKVPSVADVPAEVLPAHGYYAPTRLTLYVMSYNTNLVAPN